LNRLLGAVRRSDRNHRRQHLILNSLILSPEHNATQYPTATLYSAKITVVIRSSKRFPPAERRSAPQCTFQNRQFSGDETF
jgi:hypothetical protein